MASANEARYDIIIAYCVAVHIISFINRDPLESVLCCFMSSFLSKKGLSSQTACAGVLAISHARYLNIQLLFHARAKYIASCGIICVV